MADEWILALRDHLAANGLGVTGDTLFRGMMNDTDQATAVTALNEYNGRTFEVMNGFGIDAPQLQLAVRAPTYAAARARGKASRTLLRQIVNQTVQGVYFSRVQPVGTLRDVGKDDKGRQLFTADFSVWVAGE